MTIKELLVGTILTILSFSGLDAAAAAGAGAGNVSKFKKYGKQLKPLNMLLMEQERAKDLQMLAPRTNRVPVQQSAIATTESQASKTFEDYFNAAYGPNAQQKESAHKLMCPICREYISAEERPNMIIEPCPGWKTIHPVCKECCMSYDDEQSRCPECQQKYVGINLQVFQFSKGLKKLSQNRFTMETTALRLEQERVQRSADASMNGILAGVVVAAGDAVYCVYKRKLPDFKSAAAKGFVAMMTVGGLSHMYANWKNAQS